MPPFSAANFFSLCCFNVTSFHDTNPQYPRALWSIHSVLFPENKMKTTFILYKGSMFMLEINGNKERKEKSLRFQPLKEILILLK